MKALASDRPSLAQDLQFAVLQTLPLASTPKEVVDHERRHKAKLGSWTHGLNSNWEWRQLARARPQDLSWFKHSKEHCMWNAITGLVAEIKRCDRAGATTAAVAMAYIAIDTMAFLGLPADREKQTRADFIAWVDAHLKAHEDQPYQYRGMDVYGARCAVLHAFSTETNFHQQYPDAKRFGYHDGGLHGYDPAVDAHFVLIGTASFLNDVVAAVGQFVQACQTDAALRTRVEARLPQLLATFPALPPNTE